MKLTHNATLADPVLLALLAVMTLGWALLLASLPHGLSS